MRISGSVLLIIMVAGCGDNDVTIKTADPNQEVNTYQRSRPFDEHRGVNKFNVEAPAIETMRAEGVPMPTINAAPWKVYTK